MDDAGMPAEEGVLFGVSVCWDDWEGVGLTTTKGVGVACLLLWTAGSGRIWHAESNKQMQINAIMHI
jgi:hypothetical protein